MIETICFIGPRLVKLICKCSSESKQGILASNKYFTLSLSSKFPLPLSNNYFTYLFVSFVHCFISLVVLSLRNATMKTSFHTLYTSILCLQIRINCFKFRVIVNCAFLFDVKWKCVISHPSRNVLHRLQNFAVNFEVNLRVVDEIHVVPVGKLVAGAARRKFLGKFLEVLQDKKITVNVKKLILG